MFPIKLDKTNIILLAAAVLLSAWSVFIPVSAGGFFPLVVAIILVTFVRSVYIFSGKNAALLMALLFLLVPLVLFAFYYALTSNSDSANTIGKLLPRILIFFAALLGVGILYTITKIGIAIVSPETSKKIELSLILRDVKTHFGFLLEKGYNISHLDYVSHPLAGWHFQLDSPDDKVSIVLDQQERTLLAFGKEKSDKQYQIFLEAMVYYLTDKKVFIGNSYIDDTPSRGQVFEEKAKLLKSYINQIEYYLYNDFEKSKNELNDFQEQYVNLLIQESKRRYQTRKQ